jgi:hypothetical protein
MYKFYLKVYADYKNYFDYPLVYRIDRHMRRPTVRKQI